MSIIIPLFAVGTFFVIGGFFIFSNNIDKQTKFIKNFNLPQSVVKTFLYSHPNISINSFNNIECTFKQYMGLQLLLRSKKFSKIKVLILPSLLVHDLWYIFSQDNEYPHYCNRVFGKIIPFYNNLKAPLSMEEAFCFDKTYHYIYDLEKYSLGYKYKNIPLLFKIDSINGINSDNVEKFLNAKITTQLAYIPAKSNNSNEEYVSNNSSVDIVGEVSDLIGSFLDD